MTIQSILKQHGIPYKEVGHDPDVRQGWIGLHCPWCGKQSSKFHLGINIETNRPFATCWQCGSKRLIDVLVELIHESPSTCYHLLEGLGHLPVKALTHVQGTFQVPSGVKPMTKMHRQYLRARGLDPDEIERIWGVQGIGLAARLSWRLWIPIHFHGEVVSWTTRAIGETDARYITARPEQESVPIKSILYGSDLAQLAVIICEGPIDAWAIGPGATATCGVSYTRSQLMEMSRFSIRAICFDAESTAQKRARRLARQLQVFPGETHVVILETGKDPAEADKSEIKELRRKFLDD